MTRIALARLGHQRVLAAALGLGLLAAVALAASVPLLQAEAKEVALHSVLGSLGSKRYITVEQFSVRDAKAFEAFQADAGQRVTRGLGSVAIPAAQFSEYGTVRFSTVNGKQQIYEGGAPEPSLAYYRDLGQHVSVKTGVLPQDAATPSGDLPISLSAQGAQLLYLTVGDRACLPVIDRFGANRGEPSPEICLKVAAVWEPRRPGEDYWAGSVPNLFLMLSRDDYFRFTSTGLSRNPSTGHYFATDASRIDATNAEDIVQRLNTLRGYFQVRREGLFSTGLDTELKSLQERQRVAAFTIQLVAAALLLIALYSVAFAATYFLEGQAAGAALLRARGWSPARVWRLLMLEQLLLAVIAVPTGLALAWLLTWLVSRNVYGASAQTLSLPDVASAAPTVALAVAAAVGLLALLAALASRRDVLEIRRAASRSGGQWWRRGAFDLILALLALPLLAEARLRGSGRLRDVAASDDPLSLLLPSLALAFLAVASLRLLPLAALAARRLDRSIAGALAAAQVSRQPGQHARVALLLTFAVAVGVFTSLYASSERQNALDRARYQAGADVRATYELGQQPPPLQQVLTSLRGVRSSSLVLRTSANPGRSNLQATLLAVEPTSFAKVAWSRGGSAELSGQLRPLAREDPDGLRLPGQPHNLSIWVFSSGLDTALSARLTAADGQQADLKLGDLGFSGYQQLSVPISFGASSPAYPLKLRSLTVLRHAGGRDQGELALSDLALDGTIVDSLAEPRGWWRAAVAVQTEIADLTVSARHEREGRPATDLPLEPRAGDIVVRPQLSTQPLPILAGQSTLAKLGISLRDSFPLHLDVPGTTVTAVGALEGFPTLYPGAEDYLVAPLDSLVARLVKDGGQVWPNELWLAAAPGDSAGAAGALSDQPGVLQVLSRSELETQALANPLRLTLNSTLVIGFAASLLVAAIGFSLHFLGAVRTRLDDYVILQANGLSPRLVRRSLAIEERLLIAQSLLAGAVLGTVLAITVLPALQLGSTAADTVPPTVVRASWFTLASALAAVLVTVFLAGWLVGRTLTSSRPLDRLRQLG